MVFHLQKISENMNIDIKLTKVVTKKKEKNNKYLGSKMDNILR